MLGIMIKNPSLCQVSLTRDNRCKQETKKNADTKESSFIHVNQLNQVTKEFVIFIDFNSINMKFAHSRS